MFLASVRLMTARAFAPDEGRLRSDEKRRVKVFLHGVKRSSKYFQKSEY